MAPNAPKGIDSAIVKEIVKVEHYKGKHHPKQLVESVTSRLVPANFNPNNPSSFVFDPKPFIRGFDTVAEELLRIKKKLQTKIEDQEDEALATDSSRRRKMKEFSEAFDEMKRAFDSLDSRISEVGNTAIRIGEQLETIDKQCTRASEAKDLIQYFLEFNAGSFTRLDNLRKMGFDGEHKAAIIARRLNTIAKEVDTIGTEMAKSNIEKYCESLEKSLLLEFDQAYGHNDRETMNQIAKILTDFNGGVSCVQLFVNQHPFFINLLKIAEAEVEPGTRFGQEMPPADPTKVDPSLKKLYAEIRQVIMNEWEAIYAVFPNGSQVIQTFVQRIFAQSIQNFLENLFRRAQEKPSPYFLQLLASSHNATASLVHDLIAFDNRVIAPNVGSPALRSILNRCFEDLFVPWVDGDRYLNLEVEWLCQSFDRQIGAFRNYLANRYKTRTKSPTSKYAMSPGTYSPMAPSPSVTGPSEIQTASGLSVTAFMSTVASTMTSVTADLLTQNGQPQVVIPVNEGLRTPNLDAVIRCIHHHIQSVHRCRELSPPTMLAKNTRELFQLLIELIGQQYIDGALDIELESLMGMDTKSEPEFGHIMIFKLAAQTLHLIQIHFTNTILPNLVGTPNIHRETILSKNEFISSVEQKVNMMLQKQVYHLKNWFETLLGRQRRTDYKPKDESVTVSLTSTPVCSQIIDILKRVKAEAEDALDGENKENYLSEVGLALNVLLLDHYKKFSVSHAGGLIVAKDLAKYHETIAQFKVESLTERFHMLKEIGNLFIVKPENLKTVINEGHLARIDIQLLYPYLQMRTDWSRYSYRFETEIAAGN